MAEHREELVLRAVRAFGLAARGLRVGIHAGIVEGQCGALRQLREQRAVVVAEASLRLRLQRGEGAERAAARHQRHDEVGAHADRLGELQQVAVADRVELLGRIEVGQMRTARGHGPCHRARRVGRRAQPLHELGAEA